jgi:hypothetical protein
VLGLGARMHGAGARGSGPGELQGAGAGGVRPGAGFLGRAVVAVRKLPSAGGGPVPEATPWDQGEVVGACAYPLCKYWETMAAQGEVISQDATPGRILAWSEANQEVAAQAKATGAAAARTGRQPTAVIVQGGERRICWYDTGRRQAGENLEARLTKRASQREQPLVMSEALTSTKAAEPQVMRCPWLAHGRRKVSE